MLDCIQDRLVESRIPRKLEEIIAHHLAAVRMQPDARMGSIQRQLVEATKKIQNLVRSMEDGQGSAAVADRIRELEEGKQALENEKPVFSQRQSVWIQ